MPLHVDVLVIGAGQAGLSMGYFLRKSGMDFVIADAGRRIGDSWRKRYDSLVLFTPRAYSGLPGMPFPGQAGRFPTKDETADYLESYAGAFELPVLTETAVLRLERGRQGYIAATTRGDITAGNVVIAAGPFQKPSVPAFAAELNPAILQFHSSEYRNPDQLRDGEVFIVGGGNSGAQIAVELASSRPVTLAIGHSLTFLPLEFASKSIFWWFDRLGLLRASVRSPIGRWLSKRPDPIFGLELQELIRRQTVTVKPKAIAAEGQRIFFEDGSHRMSPANVIWATGFRPDYSWLKIDNLTDSSGNPIHDRGVTAVPGIYFLGLPWLYRRGSALLGGVGQDAEYLCRHITRRRGSNG